MFHSLLKIKFHDQNNKSAINLMMCMYAELRWSGKGKKRTFTNNGDISFNVDFNELYENIIFSDTTVQILGGGNIDGQGNVFYVEDNLIYQYNDLEIILKTAIRWEEKLQNEKIL